MHDCIVRLGYNTSTCNLQPQHSLPDLFIWLIVDGKRISFYRAASKHFMFSIIPEEKGMNCGHLQAILMKVKKVILLYHAL